MEPAIVSEQRQRKELQEIAAHVVEEMDGQLYAMQKAAEQISSGRTLEEIDDAGYHLEHHNKCLDELIIAVCDQLKKRGLVVACVPNEDVIFYMPVVRADEGMHL
jgi:hypothetical protein